MPGVGIQGGQSPTAKLDLDNSAAQAAAVEAGRTPKSSSWLTPTTICSAPTKPKSNAKRTASWTGCA